MTKFYTSVGEKTNCFVQLDFVKHFKLVQIELYNKCTASILVFR